MNLLPFPLWKILAQLSSTWYQLVKEIFAGNIIFGSIIFSIKLNIKQFEILYKLRILSIH